MPELRLNGFIPHVPHPKQGAFMKFEGEEALFGGAGGGGKSDVGLMTCAQYAHIPGHAALVVRRTLQELKQPGALLHRAHAWWDGKPGVVWRGQDQAFRFACPGGGYSDIFFGGVADRKALSKYDSAEYQTVYYDELTHFLQFEYEKLKARLRRPSAGPLSKVPLRARAGTNPGNIGHEWVKAYFVTRPSTADRLFIRARMADNPSLDVPRYLKTLERLPFAIRKAILEGSWDLQIGAGFFRREWFKSRAHLPELKDIVGVVRYWDTAGTEETGENDPDWTVGTLMMLLSRGRLVVAHVERVRTTTGSVDDLFESYCKKDVAVYGRLYLAVKESTYNDDSKARAAAWGKIAREAGARFKADFKGESKVARATDFAGDAEHGLVEVVDADWNYTWLDEHTQFDGEEEKGKHDDQVDSASGAREYLKGKLGRDPVLDYYKRRADKALDVAREAGARSTRK